MSMSEDRRRFVNAGLAAKYHEWDRDVFIDRMSKLLVALRADKTAVPRAELGMREDGVVTLWHYLARPEEGGEASTRSHDPDCPPEECFDDSHPCPPLC